MTRAFYVQREPRAIWHRESPEDPEVMLCGETISVEEESSKVQTRPGPKYCPWCAKYEADGRPEELIPSQESPSPTGTRSSFPNLRTTLRDVTTRTGTDTSASPTRPSGSPTGGLLGAGSSRET